ncbi:MAG TPA: hypothetical protein DCQ26_19980 [Marinilabiliales bacterium]|jgi:O-antigen ligase|nr:MAG: hypothetical protein A2W95_18160 [Bacteroidetes bacterium GWA2_40_14]OFX57203.1 MAG: hypothetical protein A2W84_15290 [Bacteroidetes bacterium GWC2_40_13]OFX72305.1 MAG: hypothetical protein A2W96_17905 [Bacteroidetes bacterium GWD2_40_43]OFX90447.1 MAG: hypothetical protein A2W97_01495 [Bacteroidetes bacterium GWE2_40_63]OFY17307.1 MAG: hypothetical protein A2W88_15370 [Bacteroidetes bacterium GWF2_40_13]OFZ27349.1 MAG: hypothetical protein A2437_13890 [Bacteroidetes bacterium RIFOXYC
MVRLLERYFGKLEWLFIALFLIALPFIYTTKLLDPVLYSAYLVLTLLILVITILLVFRVFREQIKFRLGLAEKIIFGSAVAYLVVNIIGSFGVINSNEAVFHFTKEATYVILFFYLYQLLHQEPKGKNVIIKSVLLMTTFYLAIGYVQLYNSDFTPFKNATGSYGYYLRQSMVKVLSTLANWNLFSSYLFISLPFAIYGIVFYKKFWRILSILLFLSAIVFIFLLASKGIWGASALSLSILLALAYFYLFFLMPGHAGKTLSNRLKLVFIVSPVIIIVLGLVVVQKADIKIFKVITDKMGQVVNTELACGDDRFLTPSSTETRVYVWENTIKLFKEKPLFGIGGGQWWVMYPKYGLDRFEHDLRNGTLLFQRPHNDFLWILSENGLAGFFFYMVIFIGLLVIAFRNLLKNKDWSGKVLSALAFAFLIGFMIDMFVSFPRERVTHNVMMILLFVLILNELPKNEASELNISKPLGKVAFSFLFLLLATANLWAAHQFFKGEKAARAVKYGIKTKNFNLVYRAAHSVRGSLYTLDNFTTPMAYYEGVALSTFKNMEGAKASFTDAYAINPYHLQNLNNLATSYDLTGDKKTALIYYQKALEISPRYKEALINKAIVHYNLNEFDRAMEYILQVPAKEKNPEKFEQTMLTICKRKAIGLAEKCDETKFKEWIGDENKIKATFVKVQGGKSDFDVILFQELGK